MPLASSQAATYHTTCGWRGAVLCCAVLCCAVLCCAVLCCAVLVPHVSTPIPLHMLAGYIICDCCRAGSVRWWQYRCTSPRPAHSLLGYSQTSARGCGAGYAAPRRRCSPAPAPLSPWQRCTFAYGRSPAASKGKQGGVGWDQGNAFHKLAVVTPARILGGWAAHTVPLAPLAACAVWCWKGSEVDAPPPPPSDLVPG
jgi:hypothetical protein